MKDETKNAEKTNTGEGKLKFQQAEPTEIAEADLQSIAGGAVHARSNGGCIGGTEYCPFD